MPVPRYAVARHEEWIAAPTAVVRSQFADLDHHIRAGVHPKLRFEVLGRDGGTTRYLQEVKLLGIRQRDVFERRLQPDGTIVDLAVDGFNRGGSLKFSFEPEVRMGRAGTRVAIDVRLPLPPVVGALLRPLLEAQVRKELAAAAREDRADIEILGYPRAA
jgi:hypothetical protein